MALFKFLKGNYSNLNNAAISEGQVLVCNDTGELFVDIADDKRIKIGDFITVANLAALEALDAKSVPTSRLYYVEDGNILARSNGTNWVQVNKQPSIEELKTALGLANYLTKEEHKASEGRLDTLEADLETLTALVGTIPANYTEKDIVSYINKKAEETLSAATGGSSESAASVLAALNAYIETNDARVKAVEDSVSAINDESTGILAKAKEYVDTEDVFHTDITTVNALGGIAAGANLDGMTTHEILNTLLFPYVAFVINSSSRAAAAATLENGASQTLSSATISVTKKSKPITSIKLLNGSTVLGEKTGDEVAAGGTIKFENLGITVTKDNNPNLKFVVTDGQTSTDKTVGASTFVYPYYTGECAANATIDETLIEGLTKKVESKGNKTVTHTCENGRMVIAYPKAHGVLKSILDPNNFETIGDYTRSEVSVTGLDGTTQTYYVYASGAATVNGFKVQYKY